MTGSGDAGTRLRDLALHFLAPDLEAELDRLYALEVDHQHALEEMADLRRQLNRSSVMAGQLREQLTNAQHRIEELCPPEIIRARRDAYMLGAGFFKVVSLGRHRYATEHIPAEKVIIRED